MTPEQHRRVVELFEQLCDCDSNQQGALLVALCNGDDELRHDVESMLAADQRSSRFLETPPDEFAAGLVMSEQLRPLAGQMFGEYKLLERIGTGGMSEVFLAQDTRLGRRAALKFLSQEYESDATQLCRFEQEARAASALNHSNIVTVYGFGLINSRRNIATEFVEGTTLRKKLWDGPLALPAIFEIAIQTASALAAAHGAGIVHRDIKPENIMLRSDGIVKIVDFGTAKRTHLGGEALALAGQSELQTVHGLLVGTPRYMSPEQARGLPVDARSDVFSLGCVLYETLTASPAVAGTTPGDLLVALLSHTPLSLEKLGPECPAGLADILCRALEKDRDKRYQSADEMLVDLQSVRQDILSGSAPTLAAHFRKKDSRFGRNRAVSRGCESIRICEA
jgi:serine/threonine protein kinase